MTEEIIRINGRDFPAFTEKVGTDEGVLEVTAGTTGLMCGGREAGGRSYLSIKGCPGVDMYAGVREDSDGNVTGFEIAFSGDDELDGLIRALHFAEKTLIEMTLKENE